MKTILAAFGMLAVATAAAAQDEESTAIEQESAAIVAALPGLEPFIDGAVDALMNGKTVPGVTVSVVKDGEIVFLKGYGFASLENKTPVDPSTSMFRIGSITKTFTGLAAMQLVDQGKLDLDADVNTYLTAFKIPEAFGKPVTMGALLSHRPGFEDSTFGHLFVDEPEEVMEMSEYLANYMPKRVRPPGLTSSYSNYGISLAGYIVEVISGKDFATYLEDNIFKPLGMNHTTIREPLAPDHPMSRLALSPQLEPYLATGYAKGRDGNAEAKPFEYIHQIAPAGGMSASAEDMARYMIARLNRDAYEGGRLVSEEMSEKMRTRHYSDRPLSDDVAYTMWQFEDNGHEVWAHSGGTTLFLSNMVMLPEFDFGVFVSSNSTDGGGEILQKLPAELIDRYFPRQQPRTVPDPSPDFVERGKEYVGTYASTRRSYTQLEKATGLAGGGASVSVDKDGYLVLSNGGGKSSWVEIERGLFRRAAKDREESGYLYFFFDEKDRPVRISSAANDLERQEFLQSNSFFILAFGAAILLALTIFAGAWRRAGRDIETSGLGRVAAGVSLLTALALIVVAGAGLLAVAGLSGDVAAILFNWPTPAIATFLTVVVIFVALTALLAAGLWVVWTGSRWGLLRRVHYTVFAIACFAFVFALNEWNLVGWKYFS